MTSTPWAMGDLRKATVGHAATVKLPTADTLQCIAQTSDGEWYTSQGLPQSPGSPVEDSYYSLHRGGVRLSTMKVTAGGHGTLFDRHPDGELVIGWAGRGLVKVPFTPLKPDAGVEWGGRHRSGVSGVSFDPDHGQVMLYGGNKVTVRAFAPAWAEPGDQLFPTLTLPVGTRLRQGWTVYGDEMLYLSGRSKSEQLIEVYDLNTGKPKYSRHARLLNSSTTYWQEPEGIKVVGGRVYVGFTHGPRPYSHHIAALSAFDAHLSTDAGQFYVAVKELNGRKADGTVKVGPGFPRKQGDALWIRKIAHKTLAGITGDWAVTGYSTYYKLSMLTKEKP